MRKCCVSARTQRMCGNATTSRLFPRRAIDRAAAKTSSPGGPLGLVWRGSSELLSSGYLSSWFTGSRACARSAARTCSSLPERESSQDYTCGPLGYPYDIFKLSALAAMCRVNLCSSALALGRIHHPLSRRFLKRSLALVPIPQLPGRGIETVPGKASASTPIVISVRPDVGFLPLAGQPGLRHSGRSEASCRLLWSDNGSTVLGREYSGYDGGLRLQASGHGYAVRLLIGDIQYDIPVMRGIPRYPEQLGHVYVKRRC